MSSLTYLKQLGFSTKIINEFWVPFYQGVFLENDLSTDFKMLQFTFKMFSDKGAAVPKLGMQAIPNQLAATIGFDKIKLIYLSEILVRMRMGGASNFSLRNKWEAHLEDREAWRLNGIKPNPLKLMMKPLSKVKQYFKRSHM